MARFDDDPDLELKGILAGGSKMAFQFMADSWSDPEWIPRSQSDWIPDPDRADEKGGTLMIRAWLAKKNGWTEI